MKLTICLSIFLSTVAFAGKEGGGGDAVLCYGSVSAKNQVVKNIAAVYGTTQPADLMLDKLAPGSKPELADLFLARKKRGYPGSTSSAPIQDKTADDIYAELKQQVPPLMITLKNKHALSTPGQWVEEDYGVVEINDETFSGKFPKNCVVAQLAFYNDTTSTIHFDRRIAALMEKTDLEALRVHEDFYKFYRDQFSSDGVNSDRVRTLVAYIFSSSDYASPDFYRALNEILVIYPDGPWSQDQLIH